MHMFSLISRTIFYILLKLDADTLGKGAKTVHRDKSGKRRDLALEAEEERVKQAQQAAKEAKYKHWGKGYGSITI